MMQVGIVGGGIAGLYTSLLLKQQGHSVAVFESNSRVGGRIYTHYFKTSGKGHDAFFEAGAMRIPLSPLHSCVFDMVRYLNEHDLAGDKIEFIPYVLQHPNNKIYLQGRVWDATDKSLGASMGLPEGFHGKTARELLFQVMSPWIDLLSENLERGLIAVLRYDHMTFRQYLRDIAEWPDEVIDFVELVMSQTSQYDQGFTDLVLQTMHFANPEWVTVKGGLTCITDAAAKALGPSSVFRNAPVTEIHELPDGKLELVIEGIAPHKRLFDKIILALPPAAIQNIRVRPKWSFMKERAIQAIHEGPLYKMGLHFQTRFWEQTASPCFGGQTQTDLRIRWIVYPSNDLGSSDTGCLMVYAGMTDALRWSWTTRQQRVKLALEDLNTFFRHQGVDVYSQFIEAFDVHWPSEVGGGNTMYLPGQFTRFHDVMKQPEGNIYFAGEHISRHHTWVAGGIESAHQTVEQLLGGMPLPVLDFSAVD
ncbi:FAD/NAD(P)-binding domain-containing protein [Cryphonectria parasitica EP155]|uniref:Amine oxidase n=1 Tax=Cryphonectria parasitica (strain ATCC 38755 / EP155) TaxID=660469 RepID=A0A9P4YAA7_CRYP1|nr:FAD/NAD(P)-binding domain-containing protein [Cryphonectria parasitica EP155]KAF3769361.1 FAD/NAD(P)-binding domain-containing protein [Cryphonectria parasitica EP155]